MEWLSSGHLAGVKQPVQISGSESLSVEVHVCVRVFAMRYQYSATCFFRETLKTIEYINTFYLGALALLACPFHPDLSAPFTANPASHGPCVRMALRSIKTGRTLLHYG